MCPGSVLANMRHGASSSFTTRIGMPTRTTQAPVYAGRDFGTHSFNRAIAGSTKRDKFVIVDNDDGGQTIETGPTEVITITPLDSGGVEIAIEPAEVEEPTAAPGEPMPVI